ncbi:MAG: hypothetical protein KDE31_22290, partial [Caldilineaceae bacterium]|nr:hypothetical protein [Caldilineaceae bacterium]
GAPAFRILHISAGGSLTLEGVASRGGQTSVASFPDASGAGIFNWLGSLTIRNSHITLNSSSGSGSGVYNYSGSLVLVRSTVSQNSAAGDGGGLQNDGALAPATATIENSTIANNSATGGGGAIMATINGATATVNVYNSAFVNNSGSSGTGIYIVGSAPTNSVNVYNSILSNAGIECTGSTLAASANNLIDDTTCGSTATPVTNLNATLAAQGNSTPMYALQAGSNAIDMGANGNTNGAAIDQRGLPRIINATVDIGPFEFDPGQAGPVFTINTNDDINDGVCGETHCSLREGMLAANSKPNGGVPDELHFDIPGAGLHTIQPTSALPDITDPLIIDGYTQSGTSANTLAVGNDAVLFIELDGNNAGAVNGLTLLTSSSTIRGLVVNRFTGAGIALAGFNNQVEGNFIGTDPTGTLARGNGGDGIFVANFTLGAGNNTIGGATPAQRNVISANGNGTPGSPRNGITLDQVANTFIYGNYIGTTADGRAALGNYQSGIGIFRGSGTLVGGGLPGQGNLISGNLIDGITASDTAQIGGHQIRGNLIGTDAQSNPTLGNARHGILLVIPNSVIGGGPGEGNTIAGNGQAGIQIGEGTGNTISRNAIFA